MRLKINVARAIESPTAADMENALSELQNDANQFVILAHDEMTYLQGAHLGDGILLEYQDGATATHFGCYQGLDDETAYRVFLAYLHRTELWKRMLDWTPSKL